jgi:hypothetical protein
MLIHLVQQFGLNKTIPFELYVYTQGLFAQTRIWEFAQQ